MSLNFEESQEMKHSAQLPCKASSTQVLLYSLHSPDLPSSLQHITSPHNQNHYWHSQSILYYWTQSDKHQTKQIKVSLLSSRAVQDHRSIQKTRRHPVPSSERPPVCQPQQTSVLCTAGFWVTWFSVVGEHWSVCGLASLDLSRKAVCAGSLPQGLIHTR